VNAGCGGVGSGGYMLAYIAEDFPDELSPDPPLLKYGFVGGLFTGGGGIILRIPISKIQSSIPVSGNPLSCLSEVEATPVVQPVQSQHSDTRPALKVESRRCNAEFRNLSVLNNHIKSITRPLVV